jgi:hypothetical protein
MVYSRNYVTWTEDKRLCEQNVLNYHFHFGVHFWKHIRPTGNFTSIISPYPLCMQSIYISITYKFHYTTKRTNSVMLNTSTSKTIKLKSTISYYSIIMNLNLVCYKKVKVKAPHFTPQKHYSFFVSKRKRCHKLRRQVMVLIFVRGWGNPRA